ncbi:hypothetical protein EDB19DRAFT_1777029 [Suillus lakei]|nr:hypothetical protein EDB19DRAFT_1777029 [Suillus lakei]
MSSIAISNQWLGQTPLILALPLCRGTSSGTCIQHVNHPSRCISDFVRLGWWNHSVRIMWYSKRCTKPCSVLHLIPPNMKKIQYIASLCLV